MPPVRTALVSDMHLGTLQEADVLRQPEPRKRLAEALREADRVVFLGDLVELRDMPLARVLEVAAPILRELSAALAGKPVTVVPGNHDHRLIEPVIDRLRVDGAGPLELDWQGEPDGSPLAAGLARLMPDVELRLAYPGLWVRSDVYALHGHYLDLHMTVPRVESILCQALARTMGPRASFSRPIDYELALAPLYSLSYWLAQRPAARTGRANNLSRDVWTRVHGGDGRPSLGGFLLGRVAIPAGVAALNLTGVGPFSTDLSGAELLHSGQRAIATALDNLGVESGHAIFGHTHRHGPLPGEEDEPGWRTPSGVQLWNTGSWYLESALMGHDRQASPYWPGGVIYVDDTGPPVVANVLRDVEL